METLIEYINQAFFTDNSGVMNYFYQQQYQDYSPDINGYLLCFMVPPDLSAYAQKYSDGIYGQNDPNSYMGEVANMMSFLAVDFTSPQSQVNTEQISSRTGAIPYATEVTESENCSITYIDTKDLDIYHFHHLWIEYIREVLEGVIEPKPQYFMREQANDFAPSSGLSYGGIDYAASLYIVKYRPDMKTITYVAKCMGIFPQGLPNKELIGTRTSNELTTLPFTYFCTAFREATSLDSGNAKWILGELESFIFKKFTGSSRSIIGLLSGLGMRSLLETNTGARLLKSVGQIGDDVVKYADSASTIYKSATKFGQIFGVGQSAGSSKGGIASVINSFPSPFSSSKDSGSNYEAPPVSEYNDITPEQQYEYDVEENN